MLTIKDNQFFLDGEPFKIYSGAIHYFRVPREYWRDRLEKLKACGLNTVETYVCWNLHEQSPGEFDFSGNLDIVAFLKIAQDLGLQAIVRPGPYICAEWEMGGLPSWLLQGDKMRLRHFCPAYIDAVDRYLTKITDIIRPMLASHGGNIIAVQIENEYGSFGNDKKYLNHIKDILTSNRIDVLLFTSDGTYRPQIKKGTLDGVYKTLNFGSKPMQRFKTLQKMHPDNGPLMCMEFWCGWFDHWGEKHHTRPACEVEQTVKEFLQMDANFNFYMFHGGTNFGFMAGANKANRYQPTVTSYDYSALLSENGDYTPQYDAVRNLMSDATGKPLIEKPASPKTQALGLIQMHANGGLIENIDSLSDPILIDKMTNVEKFGHKYGTVVFKKTFDTPVAKAKIAISDIKDFAYLFVNGKLMASANRLQTPCEQLKKAKIKLSAKEVTEIIIVVDMMGRVNFGKGIMDKKGLGSFRVNNKSVRDIEAYSVDFKDLGTLGNSDNKCSFPKFFKSTFEVQNLADTFVDMSHFKRGILFVNGINLGRYWEIGPQVTLYLPAPFLKIGDNTIEVIEFEGLTDSPSISLLDHPILHKG